MATISDQTTNLSNLSVEGRVSGNTGAFTTTVTAASFTASGAGTSSLGTIVGSFISTTAATANSFLTVVASQVSTTGAPTSSFGTVGVTSGLSVGGGAKLTFLSLVTFSVQTVTAAATQSTTTDATVNVVASGDRVFLCPPASGLSNGVSLNAWASGNSTIRIAFSNASTVAAVVAGPVTYAAFIVR